MSAPTVNVFLSWCHRDAAEKERLVPLLTDQLALLADVRVRWWEDSHLLCGEQFGPEIGQRIAESDYGLMLLSPAYFASSFISKHELPRFVGADGDRGALPVALKRLAASDGARNYRGVEQRQVFFLRGRSFGEQNGRRDEFAEQLATEIRRRVLNLGGYRSL
jgi:hypothetical protein